MNSSDLSEIRRDIACLRETSARTDANVSWLRQAVAKEIGRGDGLEERVRRVERRQWWLAGLWTGVGALLGIGGTNGLKP